MFTVGYPLFSILLFTVSPLTSDHEDCDGLLDTAFSASPSLNNYLVSTAVVSSGNHTGRKPYRLSWIQPSDGRFIPFKRRDHSDSSVTREGSLRRSKRIRPPAFMGPGVRLVYQWDHITDGYPYSQPIGIEVLPSDEEIRRRQRHLNRLRDGPRGASTKQRSAQLRARRLEQLARRYRKQRALSLPPVERPKIQLDDDVRWAQDGHLFLPFGTTESTVNEQVIFPGSESPVIRGMTFSRAVFYTVPAFAGVWPSKSCKQPIPRLEVDVELTRVVDKEQECRQLHYDPDSVNLFAFDQQLPPSATCSPWAVQIANYAYRLEQPSFILIPKGVPYKFINATSTDLRLQRVIFS
ncbi:hypothetical protein AHF37_00442 [Paragonimus kellicotti]|nr:hypothetical protein AHF37_00442 [Paragonimus kellicotti]